MNSPQSEQIQFKSGFVACMGRPNVGKSTLINSLLGQKIAAISPRPQTTRRKQLGILSTEHVQIIFIDTPGLHHPKHKLGEKMVKEAEEVLVDCDLILFLVDISSPPNAEDRLLAEKIQALNLEGNTLLVLNKIDLITQDQIDSLTIMYQQLLPKSESLHVSALSSKYFDKLLKTLIDRLPEGPVYYPIDQITDLHEREIAADLIRAAALIHLRDEIPHGIAVRMDEYTERNDHGAFIKATLFLERENHKSIVIGKKGAMLKKIGTSARLEIESMSGRKVFLDLRVKVRKNWRNNEKTLKLFGFRS